MKTVLLSFDIEEFDMPLEYGRKIAFEEQISISAQGTSLILDILEYYEIKATFFSTVVFAKHAPDLIKRVLDEDHELASHGCYHSDFQNGHYFESKKALEEISGEPILGFRMPRMMPTDLTSLIEAGYAYNSSLNPVYLPGRYNNFFEPRTLFKTGTLTQFPTSAIPIIRVPLFWLSFHNFPLGLYKAGCECTMNTDSYLNIYFHPWEFIDIRQPRFGLPKIVSRCSGVQMIDRFSEWCAWLKGHGYAFATMGSYVHQSSSLN